jgi:hypothetical protein
MWEIAAIIVVLGGLELTIWLLETRAEKQDHEMRPNQQQQTPGPNLDRIGPATPNGRSNTGSPGSGSEVRDEAA